MNKEQKREYYRRYYAANREKLAAHHRRYYAANREKYTAYSRRYRGINSLPTESTRQFFLSMKLGEVVKQKTRTKKSNENKQIRSDPNQFGAAGADRATVHLVVP